MHDIGDNIWIRSTFLAKSDIYYRLKTSAPEYARFHRGFLWLANLEKHFVDYCQWAADRKRDVSLFDFGTHFSRRVQKRFLIGQTVLAPPSGRTLPWIREPPNQKRSSPERVPHKAREVSGHWARKLRSGDCLLIWILALGTTRWLAMTARDNYKFCPGLRSTFAPAAARL